MASQGAPNRGDAAVRSEFRINDPEEAVAPDRIEARRALLAKLQAQDGRKGAKKRRRDDRPARKERLCTRMASEGSCPYERCKFSHDLQTFVDARPPDLGDSCYVFDSFGFCRAGLSCRFGQSHLEAGTGANMRKPDWQPPPAEQNELNMSVAATLRKHSYPFYRRRKDGRNAKKEADARLQEKLAVCEENRKRKEAGLDGESAVRCENEDADGAEGFKAPTDAELGKDGANHTPEAMEVQGNSGGAGDVEAANEIAAEVGTKLQREGQQIDSAGAVVLDDGQSAREPKRTKAEEGEVRGIASWAVVKPQAEGLENASKDSRALVREAQADLSKENGCSLSTSDETDVHRMDAYPSQPKKLIDFRDKVYVAPLTTVGNLPYRRIMKGFGADITCGEMALATNLLSGSRAEWSLMRRASEEDVFGVQIAGAHRDQMERAAELLRAQLNVDFIDVNLGCPIDVVTDKGAGSALMQRPHRVSDIVKGMGEALWWDNPQPYRGRLANASEPAQKIQLTVKMRMGWLDDHPCAPSIVRRVQTAANHIGDGGFGPVAAVMIHGRSRLQRYTRAANWAYVWSVASTAQDSSMPRIPVIGNGDLLSFEDWESHKAAYAVFKEENAEAERFHAYESTASEGRSENPDDPEEVVEKKYGIETCAMLARGALIKPWLPVEIKERRHWDISAQERLDILKKFTNYGLEHWGSDDIGVNSTRRFLLEWLSFTHRYIPVGLLEHLPQKIQERPPRYKGRNELESLLASDQAVDWVRISEMLLGPVPDGFRFTPRHKANSYTPTQG